MATTASQLYFERKQKLIDEVANLPSETPLCGTIDCWTTKDQTESYLAILLQWINPIDYVFRKTLVAFELIHGAHSGEALSWSLWEALSKRGMIKQLYSITGDNAGNNNTIMGHLQHKFHGININWDRDQHYHQCACHILNLVAKDFLLYMGQLTNEDYNFFNNYLSTDKVTLEDSDNKATPSVQDVQASIKTIKKLSGQA
ncbi:hypothetical protein O181_113393 [Austropuccinia psidii MF-1]|uniref:DUF659 domain-containing protein n=1 Tax=Austropuccinia psidii MF-1 TaxID=1389203 RepID=A0A9Q3PTK7_9BASI|nr:hypothetical protein [Austropuccinia psidii MF-1]